MPATPNDNSNQSSDISDPRYPPPNQRSEIRDQKLLPPDRSHLPTEHRNPRSAELDHLDTPAVLRLLNDEDATVAHAVRSAIPAIAALVDAIVAGLEGGGRLIYLGAGTSGRLGVLDASECPPTFCCPPGLVRGIIAGGDSALRNSSEGAEDDPAGAHPALGQLQLTEHDTVVGIAAGGTTPYVLGALEYAASRRAVTALLSCAPLPDATSGPGPMRGPAIAHPISLPTGPEALTGSTRMKAGTATKLALNMISTTVMVRLGKCWGNLMVDLRASNDKLRDRALRILVRQTDLSRPDALALLMDRAGGSVKRALVMARLNVHADEADRLLARHHGRLRPLLGPPRPG